MNAHKQNAHIQSVWFHPCPSFLNVGYCNPAYHTVIYSLPLFCSLLSCHSKAPHGIFLYPHVHVCGGQQLRAEILGSPLPPFMSLSSHFITPLSPLSPVSPLVHPPTHVWPSVSTASPPSVPGFWLWRGVLISDDSGLVASQATTLPPASAALKRDKGSGIRGAGVSQTDPLRQNKPQKNIFQHWLLRGWGQAFEI